MARRSDHSREEIQAMAIQAAINILSREGLAGLSTRKVATAIGYTAGTLYLVFKNLDELILYVNAAALDELRVLLADECHEDRSPQAQLLAMAHVYLSFARAQFARWSLLYSHRLPSGMEIPGWFHDKVSGLFELVAIPLRHIQPGLNAIAYRQATYALWSSVHGVCELGLNDKLRLGGDIRAEELLDILINNFLKGFKQGWD
jgi:AcrR family transcriptional regulator